IAWIVTDLTGPSAMSSRKAATSSGFQCVGRHARGDWPQTCIASQPRSAARSCACTRPPAVETWAPMSMRVRFAPSPTGVLHIGGARTALYNWLLARGQGGTFVLRIEDTDRERSTPENVEQILEALRWLELDWDEGPLSQWERRERHSEAVERLLESGHAYEDEGAVRFRVPEEGGVSFHDAVLGEITTPHSGIKDFVIRRSDGSPLYNLAVSVDDRDGKKLSKRHGAASVQELRDAGYLPEAVRNYVSLLGWGYDESTTFMTTEELIERFSLERVSKNPAVFDEQKLRWMNGRYIRELSEEALARRLRELDGRDVPPEAVAISQEKMQTLADFWPLAGFLVERRDFDEKAWAKVMRNGAPERLRAAREALEAAEPFDTETVEQALRGVVERLDVKPKEVFQPVRVAITGTTVSPGIFESVAALGRDETLARIDAALRHDPKG